MKNFIQLLSTVHTVNILFVATFILIWLSTTRPSDKTLLQFLLKYYGYQVPILRALYRINLKYSKDFSTSIN